ncbi:hypothetical protein CBOM_07966 [Ceraceosorus bombacis]|uniref:Uncharacterized protein n=1 Tax=Ceraceosorus bombacis TaxID=401625 RepID=A0A0P1BQH5_9BASI|nr:hypothetical protein CBOM_07966 [Ceraceosorus bombacis]
MVNQSRYRRHPWLPSSRDLRAGMLCDSGHDQLYRCIHAALESKFGLLEARELLVARKCSTRTDVRCSSTKHAELESRTRTSCIQGLCLLGGV